MFAFRQPCYKCVHYIVVEEKVGACKLFGELIKLARESKALCGPAGKYFEKPIKIVAPNFGYETVP